MSLIAWIVLVSAAISFILPRDLPVAFWATIAEGHFSRAGRMRAWALKSVVPTRQVRMVSIAGTAVAFQIPPDQKFDPGRGDQHQELRFIKRGEETFLYVGIFATLFVRLPLVISIALFFPAADQEIDCFGCENRLAWLGIQEEATKTVNLAEVLQFVSFFLSILYSVAIYIITPLHVSSKEIKHLRAGNPENLVVSADGANGDGIVLGPPPSMQPIKFQRPPTTVDEYLGAAQKEHDTDLPDEVDEEVPDPRPGIFFSSEAAVQQGHYQGTNTGERISPPEISVKDELVVMVSDTEGCHIYFTTNGSPPTAGGDNRNTMWYNQNDPPPVLQLGKVVTFMAIARKPGFYDSMVTCIVVGELPVPVATLVPVDSAGLDGVLRLDIDHGVQCTDPMFATDIVYTLDGSSPERSSLKWDPENRPQLTFTSPDSIMVLCKSYSKYLGTFDFNCRIVDTLHESQESEIYTYDIKKLPAPDVYEEDSETIGLQCIEHEFAELRFTTDGVDPTPSSALYGGGVTVLSMDVPGLFDVKCRAYNAGWIASDVSELKVMRVHITSPKIVTTFVPGSLTGDGAYIALDIETHPPDANKFYTIDHSDPAPGAPSTKQFVKSASGQPIKVWVPTEGIRIRAYSEKVGWVPAEESFADILLRQLPPPVITRDYPAGTVTITADNNCEEIQFTTDGSRPRALDPNLAWMYEGKGTMGGTKVYSEKEKPEVSLADKSTTIVRAMAVAPGWIPSTVTQLTIKVEASPAPTIAVDAKQCIPGGPVHFKFDCGLPNSVYYYSGDPDLPVNIVSSSRHDLTPFVASGTSDAVVRLTAVAHAAGYAPSRIVDLVVAVEQCATPTVERELPSQKIALTSAIQGASIWFAVAAPDESKLAIPALFGGSNDEAQPGLYDSELPPILNSEVSGVYTIYCIAFKPGFAASEVLASKLTVEKVKTPSITVANGKEFTRAVKVHCGTPMAKILFSVSEVDTVDTTEDVEGEPTISWKDAKFVQYVPGSEDTVLPRSQDGPLLCRAKAFKEGCAQSGVCDFIIAPTAQCNAPTIVRLSPDYTIAMEASTQSSRIFYNIDAQTPPYPGVNSTRYNSESKPKIPATVGVHVVQAVAVKPGAAMSTVTRVALKVGQAAPPIVQVLPLDKTNGSIPVMISSEDELVSLYYTVDGSSPTAKDGRRVSKSGHNTGTMQFLETKGPLALYPDRRIDGTIPLKVMATKVGLIDSNISQINVTVPVAPIAPVVVAKPPVLTEEKEVELAIPVVEPPAPPKIVIPATVGLTISLTGNNGAKGGSVPKVKIINDTHPDWKIYYTMGEAHKLANPSPTNEHSMLYEGEFEPAVRDAEGKFTPLMGKDAMSTKLSFAVHAIAVSGDGSKSRIVRKQYNFMNGFLTDLIEEGDMKFTIERKLRRVSMKGSIKHLGHKFSTGGVDVETKMDHQINEGLVVNEQTSAKRESVLGKMREHSIFIRAIADTLKSESALLDLESCAALDEEHTDVLDTVVEELIDEAAEWWASYQKSLKWFLRTHSWSKPGMSRVVRNVYLGGDSCDEHTLQGLADSLIAGEEHVQDVCLFDLNFTEPVVESVCKIIDQYKMLKRFHISCNKAQMSKVAAKKIGAAASKRSVVLAITHDFW